MRYKFEQFHTEIEDPTIIIHVDSITVQPSKNTIGVLISLETATSKTYDVELKDIPVNNLNYEGYNNLMARVTKKLEEYEIGQ